MINYNEIYKNLLNSTLDCRCGRKHHVSVKHVLIERGAIKSIHSILSKLGYTGRVHLAADINTYKAAGEAVAKHLSAHGYEFDSTIFQNKSLAADEEAVNTLIDSICPQAECIIAIGSGTLNDITRYAAFKLGKPYIIVATAPSMDGYASSVSPLIIGGFKKTYEAVSAEAIIGDLDVLVHAPSPMLAAGFGDILGKLTCQKDWLMGHILKDEYYCEYVSSLVSKSVELCLDNVDGLKTRDEKAIEALMHALTLSGIAMLMVGNSRPASGCEHHLSHFWEMRLLQEGKEQVLHGHKVGIATALMAEKYNVLSRYDKAQIIEIVKTLEQKPLEHRIENIKTSFGRISSEVINENFSHTVTYPAGTAVICEKWDEITEILKTVPHASHVKLMLEKAGAPVLPSDIGIKDSVTMEGISNCMYVRNRYTILRLADELGLLADSRAKNTPESF